MMDTDRVEEGAGSNWFEGGLAFECTACGKCCKVPQGLEFFAGVPVDDDEIKRLADHLQLSIDSFREQYVTIAGVGYQSLTMPNAACAFYDSKTKLCRVHDARPSSCRAFPFWDSNLASRQIWDAERGCCEGVNRGPLITEDEIVARLKSRRPKVYPEMTEE